MLKTNQGKPNYADDDRIKNGSYETLTHGAGWIFSCGVERVSIETS